MTIRVVGIEVQHVSDIKPEVLTQGRCIDTGARLSWVPIVGDKTKDTSTTQVSVAKQRY